MTPESRFAEVAVPLPLPEPLLYAVPGELAHLTRLGVRARVAVGKRRVTGVVVGLRSAAPAAMEVRPLERVLDLEPVLPPDLLELARFVADYYLAPIGEVVRSMLPTGLPPWGDRAAWLTDAGALAPPRDAAEAAVVAALRERGRLPLAELWAAAGVDDPGAVLARLRAAGRVAVAEEGRRGARYLTAVELAPGDLEAQLEACGRSPAGRTVVAYLAAVGRPATAEEVAAQTGASPAVLRRLGERGLLHRFTQVERLGLDHHLMGARSAPPFALRADQQSALAALGEGLARGGFAAFLLAGPTGAGKTEIYLRAAAAAVASGRSAILLVPEIALVPALAREARERLGSALALLHSGLGTAERAQEWERIRGGEARVVLGPRSAVFAPVARLGLVVVDEEQDGAYKQETTPRYHGRDLALVRARAAGAVAVLVSATPSLETRRNAERGKLAVLRLTARVGSGELPEGVLVDLRQERDPGAVGEARFSERLIEELTRTFAQGEQVILLRNRRGYAPLLLCRACGEDMRCPDCGLPRTWHRRDRRLVCHYCGARAAVPERCPACGQDALEAVGAGTERVEERFRELFPGVPAEVLDRDAVRRKGSVAAVLERFASGAAQALIGTQLVAKGHHFPRVGLTAVLAADSFLFFPDFRAVERTYTMLTQLAGRAGRGERRGRVVIQTFHPEHYAIRAALAHDDTGFAAEEMRFRRLFHYPPYVRMVQLLARDRRRDRAAALLDEVAEQLRVHALADGVRFTGPAPAPLERLKNEWRFQLFLRAASARRLNRLLRDVLAASPRPNLTIDVDPYQLL